MPRLANVGRRYHYTPAHEPNTANPANPLIAHCGAVFFPAKPEEIEADGPESTPTCAECHALEISRLYAVSDAMNEEAYRLTHEGGDE